MERKRLISRSVDQCSYLKKNSVLKYMKLLICRKVILTIFVARSLPSAVSAFSNFVFAKVNRASKRAYRIHTFGTESSGEVSRLSAVSFLKYFAGYNSSHLTYDIYFHCNVLVLTFNFFNKV